METLEKENVKKGESLIGIVPMNGHVIVKMPFISKKTKGGLIKSDKVVEEEKKALPRYVEIVAVAQNSEFNIGDYVRIAPDAPYVRVEEDAEHYGIIDSFSIIAMLVGEKKNEFIRIQKEKELSDKLVPEVNINGSPV